MLRAVISGQNWKTNPPQDKVVLSKEIIKIPYFYFIAPMYSYRSMGYTKQCIDVPGSKSQMQDQVLGGRGVWVVGALGPHLSSATSTWTEGKSPPHLSYPSWVCLLICVKGWQAKEPHKGTVRIQCQSSLSMTKHAGHSRCCYPQICEGGNVLWVFSYGHESVKSTEWWGGGKEGDVVSYMG